MKPEIMTRLKTNSWLRWGFWISIAFLVMLYFSIFFTSGTYFDGYFLKRTVQDQQTTYSAQTYQGDLIIEVNKLSNQEIRVHYNLAKQVKQTYLVNLIQKNRDGEWRLNILDVQGHLLFDGYYNDYLPFLIDKNGDFVFDLNIIGDSIKYDHTYKIMLSNVASFATFSNTTIKGNPLMFIMGALLLMISLIEVKFPLFFFKCKTFLVSDNATPSDLYIKMQSLSWKIGLVISLVFFLLAISGIQM